MHGGANELYLAMHGGGVQLPRGMQHQGLLACTPP